MQLINAQLCCETTVFHVFSPLDVFGSARYVTHLELNIDCLHARCIFSSAFIKSAFQIIIRDRFREATLFQPSVKYWVTHKHLHMSTPLKMNSKVMQYPTLPHVSSCVATVHSSKLSKLHECQLINQWAPSYGNPTENPHVEQSWTILHTLHYRRMDSDGLGPSAAISIHNEFIMNS